MNVFIIHSSVDSAIIHEKLNRITGKVYSFNPLLLKNTKRLWKIQASRKMASSQLVIFFVGKESHRSPYIDWEIKKAVHLKKPLYVVKLDSSYRDHPALTVRDAFSDQCSKYGTESSIPDILESILRYENGEYDLFNAKESEVNFTALMEQYKLFLQTSEALVSRRQAVSNFFITINATLFSLFGFFAAYKMNDQLVMMILCFGCVLGIILSVTWMKLLESYGNLNSSKMKIISAIEKRLPLSLFDAEWAVMSHKLNKKRYVSFTDNEKRVPKIMIGLYGFLMLGLIAYLIFLA